MQEFLPFFWLTASMVFVFIKILVSQPVILCCALAALIAAALSLLAIPIILQVVIFFIVSLLLTGIFLRFFKIEVPPPSEAQPAHPLIGHHVLVVETVSNSDNTGKVKLQGTIRKAKSFADSAVIEADRFAEIVALDGDILVIK